MQTVLEFVVVGCYCGHQYLGEACPECGRPSDVKNDPARERRALIAASRAARPQKVEPLQIATPDELWTPLKSWLAPFLGAVEKAGRGEQEAAPELAAAHGELERLRLSVQVARYRPWVAIWRVVDEVLDGFALLEETYLAGLGASSPGEAEASAAQAQQELDRLGDVNQELAGRLEQWNLIDEAEGGEGGDLVAGAHAAFFASGAQDLLGFERAGVELYQRLTGSGGQPPHGVGVALQLGKIAVAAVMDEARFWSVARSAHSVASKNPEGLRGLAEDARWRQEIGEIAQELRDAGIEAQSLAEAQSNRRLEIRSAIRLAHIICERAAPPLLATLLTLRTRRSYDSYARRDIGDLLKQARDVGWADWLFGVLAGLRDADAHKAFRVSGDGVEFTSPRAEVTQTTEEELADLVLGGTESILALHTAIVVAVAELDPAPCELSDLVQVDLGLEALMEISFAMSGWVDVKVELSRDCVVVRGEPSAPPRLAIIVPSLAQIPSEYDTLRVEAEGANPHSYIAPLAPTRTWMSADTEEDKDALWLEAFSQWTVDGQPVLSRGLVRKAAVARIDEALSLEGPEVIPQLERVAAMGKRLGDRELAEATLTVITWQRLAAVDRPPPRSLERVLRQLALWFEAEVSLPEGV